MPPFRGRGRGGGHGGRGRGGRGRSRGPALAPTFLEAIRSSSGESGAHGATNGGRPGAPQISRKQRRQEERRSKSQKRNRSAPPQSDGSEQLRRASSGGRSVVRGRSTGAVPVDNAARSRKAAPADSSRSRAGSPQSDADGSRTERGRRRDDILDDADGGSDLSDIEEDDRIRHGASLVPDDDAYNPEDGDAAVMATLERKLGLGAGRAPSSADSGAAAADPRDSEYGPDADDGIGAADATAASAGRVPTAGEKRRRRALSRLNREFAEDGLGDDFGDFMDALDARIDGAPSAAAASDDDGDELFSEDGKGDRHEIDASTSTSRANSRYVKRTDDEDSDGVDDSDGDYEGAADSGVADPDPRSRGAWEQPRPLRPSDSAATAAPPLRRSGHGRTEAGDGSSDDEGHSADTRSQSDGSDDALSDDGDATDEMIVDDRGATHRIDPKLKFTAVAAAAAPPLAADLKLKYAPPHMRRAAALSAGSSSSGSVAGPRAAVSTKANGIAARDDDDDDDDDGGAYSSGSGSEDDDGDSSLTSAASVSGGGEGDDVAAPAPKRQRPDLYGRDAPQPSTSVLAPQSTGRTSGSTRLLQGPAELAAAAPRTEAAKLLRRRVQGLVNRLSEHNIESVATEMAALYGTHANADVNGALLGVLLHGCMSEVQVLKPLVMVFGALIAALHVLVGPGVGAFALEAVVSSLVDAATLPRSPSPSVEDIAASALQQQKATRGVDGSGGSSSKLRGNLLLLLSYLFVFQVTTSGLLGSVLHTLAVRFTEPDVEMLLLSLTHAGFTLRGEDPAALHSVLKAVHAHVKSAASAAAAGVSAAGLVGADAAASDAKRPGSRQRSVELEQRAQAQQHIPSASSSSTSASSSSIAEIVSRLIPRGGPTSASAPAAAAAPISSPVTRNSVMLELLLDLKNNRRRPEHEAILERGTALRRWLGRLAAKSVAGKNKSTGSASGGGDRALRISWADLMSVGTHGRWWLVGSSWAGRSEAPNAAATRDTAASAAAIVATSTLSSSVSVSPGDAALLTLASTMRMNTPTRRAVFVALMGAEDADDALERMLRLGLRGPNEREIVRVLLDCAGQEAAVNAFYADVALKLCEYNPRFKFTLQLAFWDALKTLEAPRRTFNLARLLAVLISRFSLSLSVLKVVDFTSSAPSLVLFVKALLTAILLDVPALNDLSAVFSRLGGGGSGSSSSAGKRKLGDGDAEDEGSRDKLLLRDGLLVFLHANVSVGALVAAAEARRGSAATSTSATVRPAAELRERLRAARKALESVTGTVTEEVMGY